MATATTSVTKKTKCKYWEKCYRKDAAHKKNFVHPGDEEEDDILLGKYNLIDTAVNKCLCLKCNKTLGICELEIIM